MNRQTRDGTLLRREGITGKVVLVERKTRTAACERRSCGTVRVEDLNEGNAGVEISVIIPSFESGMELFSCVESLRRQAVGVPFEIIIVESGAVSAAFELEGEEDIRLVVSRERLYPGTARNLGARSASGKVLCFLDSDCEAAPDWLARIWDERPDINRKAVGGTVLNGTPDSATGSAYYFSGFSAMMPGSPGGPVRFLPSLGLALGAEAFREVGGFRDYRAGEDVAFGLDCALHGIQPVFHPELKVTHLNSTRLGRLCNNQRWLGWGAGNNRVRNDLPGKWVARLPFLWPLIPAARFASITARVLRRRPDTLRQFLKASPLVALGALFYGYGFARGALEAFRDRTGAAKG